MKSDMDIIMTRLTRLEKQNRRLRQYVAFAFALMLISLAIGGVQNFTQAQAQKHLDTALAKLRTANVGYVLLGSGEQGGSADLQAYRQRSMDAVFADLDEIMKLGMNHPMGPLALADLIGLDVCLDIINVLFRDLGEDRYRPCPLLRKMVMAGRLGRKTKQGFFSYE